MYTVITTAAYDRDYRLFFSMEGDVIVLINVHSHEK